MKLKDNKNNSVIIEDVDKVNFEELTETDKKVIASRKALTFDNLVDAYERLSSQHNRSGESLGIKPTHLITGTSHTKALKAMVKDTAVQGSPIIQLESSDFLAVRTTPYMNFTPPV